MADNPEQPPAAQAVPAAQVLVENAAQDVHPPPAPIQPQLQVFVSVFILFGRPRVRVVLACFSLHFFPASRSLPRPFIAMPFLFMPILAFSYFTCVSRSGYLFPHIFALWLPSLQCVFLASLPSPPVIASHLPSFIFRLFLFSSPSLVFHPFPFLSVFVFMSILLCLYPFSRGVKRNNGMFIIPSFLLKNFRYSVVPAQKFSLFHYSCSKIFVIPLFLLKNFLYSIIPPKKHTLFHYSKNKISVILIPLFLFSPRIFQCHRAE